MTIRARHKKLTTDIYIPAITRMAIKNLEPVFRIRIGSGFNQISGSVSGFGIRIQDGKKTHKKKKKLDVLLGGLKASSVAWTSFMEPKDR
jgi:hypothetical protein